MKLTNLPTELLLEIIWNGDLDNGDLKSLRLAHSSFKHVASTYLFRNVKLQLLKGHLGFNQNELPHPQHILDRIRGFLYDKANEDVRDHVRHVEVFVRPEAAPDGRTSVDLPPMPPIPDRFSYMEKELFGMFVKRYVTKILSPECFPRLADVSLHYNAQMVSPDDVAFFFDAMKQKQRSRGGKPRFHLHIRKCSAVGEELDHVVSLCSLRLADLFIYEEQTERFAKLIARVLDDSPDLSRLSLQGYGNEILLPELFHHISRPTTMNKVQELCLDSCDVTHLDVSELERFTSLKELTVHRTFGPGWSTLLNNGTTLTKLATSEMSEELVTYLGSIPEASLRHLEMRLPAYSHPQLQDESMLHVVLDRFWRSITRFSTSLQHLALTISRSQIRRAANNNAVGEGGLSPWCINVLSKISSAGDPDNNNRFTKLKHLDVVTHLNDDCIATLMEFAAASPNLQKIKTTIVGRVQTGDNGHLYSIGFKRGEEEVAKVLQQVLDYRFKEESRWGISTVTTLSMHHNNNNNNYNNNKNKSTPTLRISAALENYGAWRLEPPPHHYKIDRMMEIDAPRFVFQDGAWRRDPLDSREYAAWGRMKQRQQQQQSSSNGIIATYRTL